jgi:hypothetical protein
MQTLIFVRSFADSTRRSALLALSAAALMLALCFVPLLLVFESHQPGFRHSLVTYLLRQVVRF